MTVGAARHRSPRREAFTVNDEVSPPSSCELRFARIVLAAGIAVWAASALIHWWLAVPLGHDEARSALAPRDILDGRESRFIYAGGGMTGIAIPGVLLGAT